MTTLIKIKYCNIECQGQVKVMVKFSPTFLNVLFQGLVCPIINRRQ
jgi:hypothetical protein